MSSVIRNLINGQRSLMEDDKKRFAEYDSRVAARAAGAGQQSQDVLDQQNAAEAQQAEINKPAISSAKPISDKDWRKFVNSSTTRQERYDPQAAAERHAISAARHIKFDQKYLDETGMFPEEVQHKDIPDHIKRKQWIKEMGVRYKDQLADGSVTMDQLLSESPYAATGKGPSDLRLMMDAKKQGQIAMNVQNAAKQTNIARQLGVGRGHVLAMQDVQKHLDEGDTIGAAAKMGMYGMDPDLPKQMIGAAAAEAEALAKREKPKPTGTESMVAGQADIAAMPAGPNRLAAMRVLQTQAVGPNAKPEDIDAAVRNQFQQHAQEMANRGFDNLKPEERAEFQQATQGLKSYEDWLRYLGKADTPELQAQYQKLTGKNATWVQFRDSWNPFG